MKIKSLFWGVIIIFGFLCLFDGLCVHFYTPPKTEYSKFESDVNSGNVNIVFIDDKAKEIRYTLHTEGSRNFTYKEREALGAHKATEIAGGKIYRTDFPGNDEFKKDLLSKNIIVKSYSFTPFYQIIFQIIFSSFGLTIILFGSLFHFLRKNSIPEHNMTHNTADSSITFDDIIGHDEIIEDFKRISKLLKYKSNSNKFGDVIPKGVLLSGEPGTGKTLLAKALANSCGVPFVYANASEFVELYVGMGAKKVRKLFKDIRKVAPAILFIDEIDAVGISRNSNDNNSERLQTLNALLQEIDGFAESQGIFVVAATNNADKLDSALTRAGRFDRRIEVLPPKNAEEREQLFKLYLPEDVIADCSLYKTMAIQTTGFTGADIKAVCVEAKLIALSTDCKTINLSILQEALDKKLTCGNKTKSILSEIEKEIVAYHEAGHAVMLYLCNKPIARATILPNTSGVGGFVLQSDDERVLKTKNDVIADIMVAYAGRCAEIIRFKTLTSGSSNDIQKATLLINKLVDEYCFDSSIGVLNYDMIDKKHTIKRKEQISRDLFAQTLKKLRSSFDLVEVLSKELLKKESLNGSEIYAMLDKMQG